MAAPVTTPTLKVIRGAGIHARKALYALREFEREYPTFQVDARIALERCAMLVSWIESAETELVAREKERRWRDALEGEFAAHLVGANPPSFGRISCNEADDPATD